MEMCPTKARGAEGGRGPVDKGLLAVRVLDWLVSSGVRSSLVITWGSVPSFASKFGSAHN